MLFITIDTEEDQWGVYNSQSISMENIKCIPYLQELFDRFEAIPTYLVTYPVTKNRRSVSILKEILKSGRCEIGSHCHPWNTPPFNEGVNVENSMLCNLPIELQYEKIKALHESITENFDTVPISFRAGRYGFGRNVARNIHKAGYRIDSSIPPFTDWSKQYGPDFWSAPTDSYWLEAGANLKSKGEKGILEIPPTVGFLQRNFNLCARLLKLLSRKEPATGILSGILDRMRIINYRWLSPEVSKCSDMIQLAKNFLETKHSFLNMVFHSTSLVPSLSPFVRSKVDLGVFYDDIARFLEFAVEYGMVFSGLSEALKVSGD